MSKNAFVLRGRGINHGADHHAKGSIIRGMSPGQFRDWADAGLVREATAAEVAGKVQPARTAATKPKPKARPKRAKPAPRPQAPAAIPSIVEPTAPDA